MLHLAGPTCHHCFSLFLHFWLCSGDATSASEKRIERLEPDLTNTATVPALVLSTQPKPLFVMSVAGNAFTYGLQTAVHVNIFLFRSQIRSVFSKLCLTLLSVVGVLMDLPMKQ